MPDMPQGAPAPAPGGAPPAAGGPPPQGDPQGGQGGGIAEAIAMVDATVNKIAQAVAQNPQVPDEVKAAWQDALGSLRKAEQALVQAAGGEADGEPEPDEDDQGTTTMEQGGNKGAVPMTHQSLRGR